MALVIMDQFTAPFAVQTATLLIHTNYPWTGVSPVINDFCRTAFSNTNLYLLAFNLLFAIWAVRKSSFPYFGRFLDAGVFVVEIGQTSLHYTLARIFAALWQIFDKVRQTQDAAVGLLAQLGCFGVLVFYLDSFCALSISMA